MNLDLFFVIMTPVLAGLGFWMLIYILTEAIAYVFSLFASGFES